MKQKLQFILICLLAFAVIGCTVTYPASGERILAQTEGTDIIVHTVSRSYKFYTYTTHESILTGFSQIYQAHAPGEPMKLDVRFPPLIRNIELRDILRIETTETRVEPIADAVLYGLLPCAAILGVLIPIITHGTP